MKIVFIGTVKFSKVILAKLIDMQAQIVGVCTKKQSKLNSDFADLVPLCISNKIIYKYVDNVNSDESIEWIDSLKPDIIFCFGWSSLIKKELLNLTPMGVLGYHPTKLPQNRGRHPLIWSLALGLKKSASTFFFMDEGADSGDILSQIDFDILKTDNAQTLYNKIIDISLKQIEQFMPQLENKNYKKIKQKHNKANTWRKREVTDGKVDFRMTSEAIYNLIRALTKPYIGAHVVYKNKNIIVWRAEVEKNNQKNIENGKILNVCENTITVKTYDGSIKLVEHEFEELPVIGEYF